MERYRLTQKDLANIVLESANRLIKEKADEYLSGLVDSVSVALADKYGFGSEAAYTAAEKSVAQLDDVDKLTGEEEEDFNMCLQRAMANFVNESLAKKKIVKEEKEYDEFEEYQKLYNSAMGCLNLVDETFKRDDINNVSPRVLKKLIMDIYEELNQYRPEI